MPRINQQTREKTTRAVNLDMSCTVDAGIISIEPSFLIFVFVVVATVLYT